MLDDLPSEILLLVSQSLATKDLSHLIRSSRRLYHLLQQRLYTEVKIAGWNGSSYQVVTFLYAITRNPELASYVRYLEVGPWDCGGGCMDDERITFDDNLVHKLVSERNDYTEREKSKWIQDLKLREDCDPWVALLVPQLNDLQKLGVNWRWPYRHVFRMFRKTSRQGASVFPHLQEVYMSWEGQVESSFPSTCINPIFYFPSVTKLACDYVSEWIDTEDENPDFDSDDDDRMPDYGDHYGVSREIIPPRISNITHLDMANADCSQGMREWLHACKALKSCRLIHHSSVSENFDYQPRKIYESLSLHKLTLESVWSEIVNQVGMEADNDWMGSFAEFPALKVLCVSLPNLVGFDEHVRPMRALRDVLPPSLETLYIISCEHGNAGHVTTLLEFFSPETLKSYPRLAALHIDSLDFREKPETIDEHESLKQQCQEAGIDFLLHTLEKWSDFAEKPSAWLFGPPNEARNLGRDHF